MLSKLVVTKMPCDITHQANICSWNIPWTFTWDIPSIFGENSQWIPGNIPKKCSGNIENKNIPWLLHEYTSNVTPVSFWWIKKYKSSFLYFIRLFLIFVECLWNLIISWKSSKCGTIAKNSLTTTYNSNYIIL